MKADFEFYTAFCGGNPKIPSEEYERFEKSAERELSRITGGKSDSSKEDEVLRCICEIAEVLYVEALRLGIESENNDGYSVKYNLENTKQTLVCLAERYLCGTDYLYRGVGYDG